MRGSTTAGASALVLVALMAAGCSGESSAPPGPTGEVAQAASEGDTAQDAAACAAVSDVQSIVENADIALSEGRMAVQEQQGWYEVATHVLHRIPSDGESAVSLAVADLQDTVPAVETWARTEPTVIRSDAWRDAFDALAEPCVAADAELFTLMFTGG